jgi:hypothetical protein
MAAGIASAEEVIEIDRVAFTQIEFLVVLCFLHLASLLASGSIKYWLNGHQGWVDKLLVRRLRLTVYRGWRRNGRPGGPAQLIPIVVQGVEPVGGFAREAFVTPALQGGTLLTLLAFMLIQDPVLGGAALLMVPIQLLVIPPLQRRINEVNRTRVRDVRRLGGLRRDARPMAPPALSYLRDIVAGVRHTQPLRFRLFTKVYLIRSSINLLKNLIPFFLYLIGGHLFIQGQDSFGALVAALAAHKYCSAPLHELPMYCQISEDVGVGYHEMQRFVAGQAPPAGSGQGRHPAAARRLPGTTAADAR